MNLKEKVKEVFYNITDGRPMTYTGYSFTDKVTHQPVNRYTDKFGRKWLAESEWSRFRIERS